MALTADASDFSAGRTARGHAYVSAGMKTLLDRLVTVWIFMSGMIIVEPSPYEFVFAIVAPVALFAGLKLYRSTLPLIILAIIFTPFAIIGAFQATYTPVTTTVFYALTSVFLLLTGYFLANYVTENPQERMRRIMRAYTAIAVISAAAGTAGYLHLVPESLYDILTRYGRAKGFFQDPNVYGPFLIPAAIFALQRMMLGARRAILLNAAIVMVILVGLFVSFSRAAWGSLAASVIILFALTYILEANARNKVRMLILALAGAAVLSATMVGLLSIPSIGSLFSQRATVAEAYDSGETGRFGRQGYAFDLALQHPLGLGPNEFAHLDIAEDAHDTYVTVIFVYGWGGALCFYAILVLTLVKAFGALPKPSPNRRLLIPLIAAFVPLVVEAGIIDIDHWRYFYLLIGLIWGVTSGYRRLAPAEDKLTALV